MQERSGSRGACSLFTAVAACCLFGCATGDGSAVREAEQRRNHLEFKPVPTRVLDIVKELPAGLSTEDLETRLPRILQEAGHCSRQDMPLLREALLALREQPNVVKALAGLYGKLPRDAFAQRRLIVAVTGELQRSDAMAFFEGVVWQMPKGLPRSAEGYSVGDLEAVIAIKAVQGLAFIREEDGSRSAPAVDATLKVMTTHPSKAVRVAAIDAYLWNQGDSAEVVGTLKERLPPDLHGYIGLPRFHGGENEKVWRKRMAREK